MCIRHVHKATAMHEGMRKADLRVVEQRGEEERGDEGEEDQDHPLRPDERVAWPSARLSFCWYSLIVSIETPTKWRRGCSRMTVSSTARVACHPAEQRAARRVRPYLEHGLAHTPLGLLGVLVVQHRRHHHVRELGLGDQRRRHLAVDETVVLLTLSLSITIDPHTKCRAGYSRTAVSPTAGGGDRPPVTAHSSDVRAPAVAHKVMHKDTCIRTHA